MKAVFLAGKAISPSKVVCIGRNYADHAKELGNELPEEPVVFVKPASAIGNVLHAEHGEPLHYEAEICFMVASGKLIAATVGLDLTKRASQARLKAKGLPWERAKAFDGSALFGEFVPCNGSDGLELRLTLDGAVLQQGHTGQMLFSPESLLEEVSSFMSWEDGDIMMTGTPAGVGPLQVGGHYHAELLRHGELLTSVSWQAR
ncbi:fumarylacetoacetate hydrolase family protein [Shewanella sp. JM162201]|uniref:Fumarylacetoacetate hydrolase family protein n=1 Tax=Shewanella jiangmenensis TaxID=2837387 RepID=A0ABS5V527_9GAMM|nr:fumarylacetoacetate hydrolase family protein [Shewanella jiangmenensis]MBT1444721.1 fumarylacetoacetate hydrolase family protein [Shewanella jiangmenensis]